MEMSERWEANQARKAFDASMAAAKAELPILIKSSKVDFTNASGKRTTYDYADLAEITKTIAPILSKYGLSWRFETAQNEGSVSVTCVITHAMGHSQRNSLSAPPDDTGGKSRIQGVGSTVTFLSRYCLLAGLGLAAAKDDDARAASAPDTIAEKDVAELKKRIVDVGITEEVFCEYFSIETVADLPVTMLKRAHVALDKRAEAAKKQPPEAA